MPFPTPPEKVLAAARAFGREKFAHQHRYAMVLVPRQHNPGLQIANCERQVMLRANPMRAAAPSNPRARTRPRPEVPPHNRCRSTCALGWFRHGATNA
jgi:hypothetical protein